MRRRGIGVALLALLAAPAGRCADGADEDPLWCAAWITDTQTPSCEWISTLLARVASDRPKLVIHSGDTRFEWANRCAWRDAMSLMRIETPPIEFHLAPGNHDLTGGVLKPHLRRAATGGIYRLDTGELAPGFGYYHNRVPRDASGPLWPIWNPEVAVHPAWQVAANARPADHRAPVIPYRYVFRRSGIRFIVCDCYFTDEQCAWMRDLIAKPDASSVSIIIQHKHEVDDLAKYVEGLEGRHNVKLILSGDHHEYLREERHGVTFITAAGMAKGPEGDNDAMTLWVFHDRLRLDRYLIPAGSPLPAIEGPATIWRCDGRFSAYARPAAPARETPDAPAPRGADPRPVPALGPNLLHNGDFDGHIWYERFRGWSPAGWYQWFTRGGHAPEHAVGRPPSPPHPAHTGREYVRIHMWAHAWRGGILQVVRGVEPCHHYRLTAYGFFQPERAPEPNERIGLDPCGGLADQFSVDVTKHPAPKYDEGVGDDPKTPEVDGPDLPETTVWSPAQSYYRWGRFEVTAEARADRMTAILYCAPAQRPADRPIYEMNWDSVSLVEVPWPAERLVEAGVGLAQDPRAVDAVVTVQPEMHTAQVTWGTKIPAGAAQVLYRFLDSEAQNHVRRGPGALRRSGDFPFATPVAYERSASRHRVAIDGLSIPEEAVEMEVIALSRVCDGGACETISSAPIPYRLR
ncbi:MAG: metallophosphoesterase [Planctomycetes bacterium]|nr:metallophosphoesterase [Planctomycetota bacterium]